jgi:hypothetical protein
MNRRKGLVSPFRESAARSSVDTQRRRRRMAVHGQSQRRHPPRILPARGPPVQRQDGPRNSAAHFDLRNRRSGGSADRRSCFRNGIVRLSALPAPVRVSHAGRQAGESRYGDRFLILQLSD